LPETADEQNDLPISLTYVGPNDITLLKDAATGRGVLRVQSLWNMTQEREEAEEGANMQLKPATIYLTDSAGNSRKYTFVLSVLKPDDFNATYWEELLAKVEEEQKNLNKAEAAVNITEEIKAMLEAAYA